MTEPFFSVVIPSRNRAHLLARAIDSVLAQGFGDFELRVVDDASTDATRAVLAGYADHRLRAIHNSRPLGAAAARNRGVEASGAPWVAFLDDDDAYRPAFLETMHRLLAEAPRDTGFAWCGVRRADENGTAPAADGQAWRPSFPNRREAYLGFVRNRDVGTNCGLTIRRSTFDQLGGFDESLRCAEDTDLLIRLAAACDFAVAPQILVDVYRHSGPRLTWYGAPMAAAYRRILDKNLEALRDEPAVRAELLYKTGWLHHHAGDRRRGRRYLLAALRARPGLLKAWAALALFELLGRRAPGAHARLSRLRKGGRASA